MPDGWKLKTRIMKTLVDFNPKICKHIIFTYKGKVYQNYKDWTFSRIEKVLGRLGATYWEISI